MGITGNVRISPDRPAHVDLPQHPAGQPQRVLIEVWADMSRVVIAFDAADVAADWLRATLDDLESGVR